MKSTHKKMDLAKMAILVLSLMVLPITSGTTQDFTNVYGQTMQDISCPGCVTIPPNEIDLYRELFPIIIWVDDSVYNHKSVITVNGFLKPDNAFNPVTITVTNPIGNLVTVEQLTPSVNGDFKIKLNTASVLWKQDGHYIIKAQSGAENRSFKTSVELISLDLGTRSQCKTFEIETEADNGGTYCIPFQTTGEITSIDGFLKTESKTLILNVRGTDVDSIFVEIPRNILNAKTDEGADSEFVILINGKPADYEEQKSALENHRRIAISYLPDREGTIEIIGTSAIPEFGPIAMLILIVAITTILAITNQRSVLKNVIPRF